MLAVRKKQRRDWRQRQGEMSVRNSIKHQLLTFIGVAPRLLSDTTEERILGNISIFGKQFARECVNSLYRGLSCV